MNYKYETVDQKKLRAFNAVSALECRGRSSITLEMALDEIAFNIGEPSARTPDGRRACRGIGDALAQLVADGTLYTKNRGNSYHITGPTCKATSAEVIPATVQPIVMQEREAELLDSSLDALLNRDAEVETGTKSMTTDTRGTDGSNEENLTKETEVQVQASETSTGTKDTSGSISKGNKKDSTSLNTVKPTATKNTDGSTKGITFDKNRHKWMFKAKVNNMRTTIGRYNSKAEAIAAKRDWESEQS